MTDVQVIANGWVSYAKANKLKPGTQKYEQAQHAYLNGAHAVLREDAPAILTIYAMTGRDVSDLVHDVVT